MMRSEGTDFAPFVFVLASLSVFPLSLTFVTPLQLALPGLFTALMHIEPNAKKNKLYPVSELTVFRL